MMRYVVAFILILLAAFSRIIPHPANFTPITAIALFGAAYLDKRVALLIPIVALLVSDYFIGFYDGMVWVYGSFLAIACIGFLLRNRRTAPMILGASISGSVLFFLVTNFGVWITPPDCIRTRRRVSSPAIRRRYRSSGIRLEEICSS